MGSVYKRGRRYWIKYRDRESGRVIRRSVGEGTYSDALDLLATVDGSKHKPQGVPLATVWDLYLSHLRSYAKPRTVLEIERASARFLAFFSESTDARNLSAAELDRFVAARQAQGVKARTVNLDLAYLRAALNHAVARGTLDSLPTRIRPLKSNRKRVLPVLGPEEIRRLLDTAREPYYGIILVSAHTGFRLDETLHLTWSDVLWSEERLAVTAKDGWEPKSYQERAVYVPAELLTYLKRLRLRSHYIKPEHYVFSTRNGTRMSVDNACRGLRKTFKQARVYRKGAPLSHWIRHSVCSRLLGEGVDVETVRQIMGHSHASTTLLYAHSTDERMRQASQKLRVL